MHTPGAYVSKSMHPAAKRCTPGAGCTLNFEHSFRITFIIPAGQITLSESLKGIYIRLKVTYIQTNSVSLLLIILCG